MQLVLSFASNSAIGGRTENQDYQGNSFTPHGFLAVVCDGVGGNAGGSDAARIGVNAIIHYCQEQETGNPILILKEAALHANNAILDYADENRALKGMASTFVAVLVTKNSAFVCHAGDSRLYQYRNGNQIYRTNDHSHVFELLRRGIIQNERQAKEHPRANEITRALGLTDDLQVECQELNYQAGDVFLLCSDGINEALDDLMIAEEIKKSNNPDDIVNNLIVMSDNLGHKRGGDHDNITVQVIKIHKEQRPREALIEPQVVQKKKRSHLPLIIILALLTLVLSANAWLLVRFYADNSFNEFHISTKEATTIVDEVKNSVFTKETDKEKNVKINTEKKLPKSKETENKSLLRRLIPVRSLKPIRSPYELIIEEQQSKIDSLIEILEKKPDKMNFSEEAVPKIESLKGPVTVSKHVKEELKVSVESRSTGLQTRIDSVRNIQHWLNKLGYDCGRIDGDLGKNTRRKMREFQRNNDLPETTDLNKETYETIESKYNFMIHQNDSLNINNNVLIEDVDLLEVEVLDNVN